LLHPHIEKTVPFEQDFNVRRKATPKTRLSVLSGLGECKDFVQQGIQRFSVGMKQPTDELAKKP